MFEQFKEGATPPKELGPSREYNLDLVPKFMMANGKLVQGAAPSIRSAESGPESAASGHAHTRCRALRRAARAAPFTYRGGTGGERD